MNQYLHVQAHRGASLEKKENSLESVRRAVELGVDSIEIDIHLLRDGALIVFHDFFLPPSSAPKFICDQNLSAMRSFEAPTLTEVCELVKSLSSRLLWLDLEVKYLEGNPSSPEREKLVDSVLRTVSLSWELNRTRFRSFDWKILKLFHKTVSTFQTIPLLGRDDEDFSKVLELQPEWIAPYIGTLNDKTVSWAKRAGVKLMPYTVNSPSEWKKLTDWGVQGITTDDPRGLLKFLGREAP
jgi:glycerophosphoryl diester phosphodiesterase